MAKKIYKTPTRSWTEEVDCECSLDDFTDEELRDELNFRGSPLTENKSKVDDWKDELWHEHKHKFTLEQIEKLLTSK